MSQGTEVQVANLQRAVSAIRATKRRFFATYWRQNLSAAFARIQFHFAFVFS
jgi:hypothetical protein